MTSTTFSSTSTASRIWPLSLCPQSWWLAAASTSSSKPAA